MPISEKETVPFQFGWIMSSVAAMNKPSLLAGTGDGIIVTAAIMRTLEWCVTTALFHRRKVRGGL